jgi:preprotein translocase subunit SecD
VEKDARPAARGARGHDRAFIAALVLAGAFIAVAAPRFGQGGAPLIELRFAYQEPAPGLDRVEHDGELLYVEREATVSDEDIESVDVRIDQDQAVLRVMCTPETHTRLMARTEAHIGQPIAIFWKSELGFAPIVRSAIGCRHAFLRLGEAGENVDAVREAVLRRWPRPEGEAAGARRRNHEQP